MTLDEQHEVPGSPPAPAVRGDLPAALARRGVLGAGGVLLSAAALGGNPAGRRLLAAVADPLGADARALRRESGAVVERLRRDADQLVLDVVRTGFVETEVDGVVQLEASGPEPATLAFVLPAPALGEAYAHGSTALSATTPAVKAELGQPAVLVFTAPVGTRLRYDVAGLLEWSGLDARWGGADGSLLEAPYRLSVRPVGQTAWRHDPAPRLLLDATGESTAVTELWHTRLTRPDQGDPTLRVLAQYPTALKLPLDATDRKAIVALADTDLTGGGRGPVRAPQVLLTSLGAILELHGRWPVPKTGSLTTWDHRTTLGRDQYVKTVNAGFLLPWGHPAVLIEETWRRMRLRGSGSAARPTAVLEKVVTLVVTEPVVDTSLKAKRTTAGKTRGSRLPFATVRCTVRTSPELTLRGSEKSVGGVLRLAEGGLLRLPFVGIDWEGAEVPFTSTVAFLPVSQLGAAGRPAEIWSDVVEQDAAGIALGGRAIALVPPPVPGATQVALTGAQVGVTPVPLTSTEQAIKTRASFRPVLTSLDAIVPALSALSAAAAGSEGGAGGATPAAQKPTTHVWPSAYVKDEANPGGVYLRPSAPVAAASPSSLTGGLGSLPQVYQGLSTKVGAVLAATEEAFDAVAKGVSTAADVYEKLTLFGRIPLAEIIVGGDLSALPKAITEVVDQRQTVTTTLTPSLKPKAVGPLRLYPGDLRITATLAAGGERPPEHRVDARLTQSRLELGGVVRLPVIDLHVTSSTAAPFDLTLVLGTVEFLGQLAFVQDLAAVLKPFLSDDGGGAGGSAKATSYRAVPTSAALARSARTARVARAAQAGEVARRGFDPDVDVDLSGLHVSQSIALPDVQVGVFQLSGLGFGFGVDLLFAGGLGARFSFASHENPFQVLYGPFGGGGYCAIELDGGDVSRLELSLAAVGGVGIDLGVAAGAISVSAGVVLVLPKSGPLSLTAFFRTSGALEVLGLVSVSVVFEISLTLVDSDPVSLSGQAELAMRIEVCWVSKTVTASVQKTFTGGAQPKPVGGGARRAPAPQDAPYAFRDAYPDLSTWQSYADAFAPGG
ncbi:hypothetical protein K8Z61_05455 [Nocardioides sp. TRM66260-LWL]|uniref:hypothetical protein n=1 Tax=Nocardioides sp. TRM66260-LWL TaxID=2874478 RepID=UPI001CC68A71|nr:hypothetical protein [Nocardioides sp. TRM66260-LWL]MBZ5733936.1 hypothetical protein [Nocardioides sp. TRM66260-LWL]